MQTKAFLSRAEAAYVAGLGQPAISRAVAEHIVSTPLMRPTGVKRFSRLAAAFISFYWKTETVIPQWRRKAAMAASMERITATGKMPQALGLELASNDCVFDFVLTKYLTAAANRAKKLDAALDCISISNDVMWGMPVFAGTRVLVETVLGSLQEGTSLALLKDSYPFLTEDLIDAAEIYTAIHPFQGHHLQDSDIVSVSKLKNVEITQSAENELASIHRRMPVAKVGDDGT